MRVRLVRCYDDRLIEENLFALERADLVLPPNLIDVFLVPFESEVLGEIRIAHTASILWTYTNVKMQSGPGCRTTISLTSPNLYAYIINTACRINKIAPLSFAKS